MVALDAASAGQGERPDGNAAPLIDRSRFLCLGEGEGASTLSVRRLVAEVVARGDRPWLDVEQALDAGDWGLAQRLLHALRGSLGTLGALPLAEALRRIELDLKAGEPGQVLAGRAPAAALYRDSLKALADWLRRHPLPDGNLASAPANLLPQLLGLLRGHDLAALDLGERYRDALQQQLGAATAAALDGYLRAFDFTAATALLQRFEAAPKG